FITPLVSVSIVWGWMYDPQFGVFNWILAKTGVLQLLNQGQPIAWLYEESTAMWAIILLRIWKNVGYNLVIFLAGLQAVPPSLYESSEIDGATPWQTFWRVTLPMITPTLFFVGIMTL